MPPKGLIRRRGSKNGLKSHSAENISTNLYVRDHQELMNRVATSGTNKSAELRELVRDYFRLKSRGKHYDRPTPDPSSVYKKMIEEKLTPISAAISQLVAGQTQLFRRLETILANVEAPPAIAAATHALVADTGAKMNAGIDATRTDISEMFELLAKLIQELMARQKGEHSLLGNTFACEFAGHEILLKYLVQPHLEAAHGLNSDEGRQVALQERDKFLQESLEAIRILEDRANTPSDIRMTQPAEPAP